MRTFVSIFFTCLISLSGYAGWEESGISEKTLTQLSSFYPLTTNTVYRVTNDVTISASPNTSGLLLRPGITVFDIASNCTLKVTGGDSVGLTPTGPGGGAGSGIFLPSGATLIVTGKGRLEAKGGAAGVGGNGEGGLSRIFGGTYTRTKGGNGGFGGGGAGAAIGGSGGAGGAGGLGVLAEAHGVGKDNSGHSGQSGRRGGDGSVGSGCGNLVLLGNVYAKLTGGERPSGCSRGGDSSLDDEYMGECKYKRRIYKAERPCKRIFATVCGRSGGGGGGAPGSAAPFFGSGGSGGGGGGGGGGGATVCASVERVTHYSLFGRLLEYGGWAMQAGIAAFARGGCLRSANGGCGAGWLRSRDLGGQGFGLGWYPNGSGAIVHGKHYFMGGDGGEMGATPTTSRSGELYCGDLARLKFPLQDSGQYSRKGRTFDSGIVSEIVFEKAGGNGGADKLNATLGMQLPTIVPPTRNECRFKGYFTEPNGCGDRYFSGNGEAVRVWDIARERVTLYAHWTVGDDCGIRINGKNPATDEISGVKFYRDQKSIVIDVELDEYGSPKDSNYVVSGTDENGYRLVARCETVCLSNLTIRLPPQTADQIRLAKKIPISFEYGGGRVDVKEYVCRSPLTVFRPRGGSAIIVQLLGTNVLSAAESGENGGSRTSVPAISMFGDAPGDYFTLVFDSGYGSNANGFGRLKLVGAGGAPAVCMLADVLNFTGLRSGADNWCPVVVMGGTCEFIASTNLYDSGMAKHGQFRTSYSPAVGLNGSLRSEIVWSKNCLNRLDQENKSKFELISDLDNWARPSIYYSCVKLSQPEAAEQVKVNRGAETLGDNGEVLVDVESEIDDGDAVAVIAYTSESFDSKKSVFRSVTPIDGVLHLWFDLQNTRYFTVNGIRYRARAVAQTVWAERYEPCVMHVETGRSYHTFAAALAVAANNASATLRLLRNVSGERIDCALNGSRRLVINGDGYVISNAVSQSAKPMFDVSLAAELIVSNVTISSFRSDEVPLIRNSGRLRLDDCHLCDNDVGPEGVLVWSVSDVKDGVDFEAEKLFVHDNICCYAVYLDSPNDGVSSFWRSGFVDDGCTNGLCIANGLLGLSPNVQLQTATLMGVDGRIGYLGPMTSNIELEFFNPELRWQEKVPVAVNAYGYQPAVTNFLSVDADYYFKSDASGNVLLDKAKDGSAFVAEIDDLPESATNEMTAVTNDWSLACTRLAEFDEYKDMPAIFGPTVNVWATRHIYLEDGVTNEGSNCAIDIPEGKFVDFGSVEFVRTNATDIGENWDCEPVTLTGPVQVNGTLRIGNVIFTELITVGSNGVVIIGGEYNTNMPIRIGLPPRAPERVMIKSEWALVDILPSILPGNHKLIPMISSDGKYITFKSADDYVTWVGNQPGQRLFKSVAEAFGNASTGEEIHLLSRPGSTVVKLDYETAIASNKSVVVNSGNYNGSGYVVGGTTTLDVSQGRLSIGRDSSVRLTNIVVSGTMRLAGEGVLDLAGWTGAPISVHPSRQGLIARNVPEGKLILGPLVMGKLWRSANGDVYYGAGGLVQWGFNQEKNGEGLLCVTNILGETTNIVLNAERYASITNSGIAKVQLDYPTLGYSTNLTVYVFYLNDETAQVFLPEGKGFKYLNEDGEWKDFEYSLVSDLESKRSELLSKLGTHDEYDGNIELVFDSLGNVITNTPKSKSSLKNTASRPKLGDGMSGGKIAFLALDTAINLGTGKLALKKMGQKFNVSVFNDKVARENFQQTVGYLKKFIKITSAFADSEEDGVNELADQIADEGDKWLQKLADAAAKEKGWTKRGKAAFATKAGIRAAVVVLCDILRYKRTPVQFGGKYYFPKNARLAYEACIRKNTDAAVHIQSDCALPPYIQTNGTLRLSGKFEGGLLSALYGMISNGKQWTSGETIGNLVTHGANTTVSTLWGLYFFKNKEGFSTLAKTTGNAFGHFVSGLAKTIADPYGAVSTDKAKPLITVSNGAKLVMKNMTVPGDKDSGVQVSVENGGTAECSEVKLKKGYTLGDKAVEKGAFTVKSGGTLKLEKVTAYENCNVLCVEDGAKSMTLNEGEFNKAGFVLNGDALTMAKQPSGDGVKVSGTRSTRGMAFAKKGDTKVEDWKNFKPASDDSLAARIKGESVVWELANPIGNVKGGKLPSAVEFSSLPQASALIAKAGSGAEVTFTAQLVGVPSAWAHAVGSGTLTINGINGAILMGDEKDRTLPLFAVGGGGRLVLNNVSFTTFKGSNVSLISADNGTLELSQCAFDKNTMRSLINLQHQANCTSKVTSVSIAAGDLSSAAITYDSSGVTNRTILQSGELAPSKAVVFSGTGTARVGSAFAAKLFTLGDSAALACPDGVPPAPIGIFGTARHLEGARCVVDNSLSATKAAKESFVSLNAGYGITNRTDGNLYLYSLSAVPPVAGNELAYAWSNDVFSVTNGYVPSVSDTNWMARTVAGTNAVFNQGRIARDALVNSTNGNLVVNCRGKDFLMSGIGATDAEKEVAISNVLALVSEILVDDTAWYDGATLSNATITALGGCVTKRELEVTAAEMTNALWSCAARFAYDGQLYLQRRAQSVFDAASASGKPVTLLRDVTMSPYALASGTLNLVANTNVMINIFINDIVRGDIVGPWSCAARIDDELNRIEANVRYGIYSEDEFSPALTVNKGAVASFVGIVCTNQYPCESITVDAGGLLKVDGDTYLTNVEAGSGTLEGLQNFEGVVGVSGLASKCGVSFGRNGSLKTGEFFSNSNDFLFQSDGKGALKWVLPEGFTLEDFAPEFAEDEPFSICFVTNDVTNVIVKGKVRNVESGLWYGFASATNLTETFTAVSNSTMSTTSGEHSFRHEFTIETNGFGQAVIPTRFFKFRVSDTPPEK